MLGKIIGIEDNTLELELNIKLEEIENIINYYVIIEDINKKIAEIKTELFELRMKQATGSLDKPHMINALRKDVARLKTVLTEKQNDGSEK